MRHDFKHFQKETNINMWFKIHENTRHQMPEIHLLLLVLPVKKKKKIFLLPSVVYSQTKITAPSIFHIAGWRLTKTNNILAWSSLYTGCWLSSWPRNTLFLQTTLRCFSVLFSTLASDLESRVTRLGHILVYAFRRAHR